MKAKTLAQALAIDSQLGLPGSAGRLLKQIRDIEHVAPMFRDAGLIKGVKRPAVVNLTVSGIASHSCIHRALGDLSTHPQLCGQISPSRTIRSAQLGPIQYQS